LKGPEKPTVIERLFNPLPGPYFIKILTFWIIFGTPGLVIARYLDTFNYESIVSLFGVLSFQNVIVFSLANLVTPLYACYGIRHMRQKVVQEMPELKQVTVDGASTMDRAFGYISQFLPSIILAVLFGVVSVASFPGQTQHVVGYLSFLVKGVGFAFAMFAYGTFVWIYASSIRGLYRIGGENLRFASFFEDRHLGMKSLGSVSLSLVWVYFLGMGLVFFSFSPLPTPLQLALIGLIVLGAVLFFLPLYEVHVKMAKEKRAAEKALRNRLRLVVETLESSRENPNEVADLLAFQVLEQKVSRISEWPFDTATLSWFSAIVITVFATIITRYVLIFLGS
jgi:hypothetical protein